MIHWATAMELINAAGGPRQVPETLLVDLLDPPHRWAAEMVETFTGRVSGHIADEVLLREGKRLFQKQGVLPADGADGATTAA